MFLRADLLGRPRKPAMTHGEGSYTFILIADKQRYVFFAVLIALLGKSLQNHGPIHGTRPLAGKLQKGLGRFRLVFPFLVTAAARVRSGALAGTFSEPAKFKSPTGPLIKCKSEATVTVAREGCP